MSFHRFFWGIAFSFSAAAFAQEPQTCANVKGVGVSSHTVTIEGKTLNYDVTTGFMQVPSADKTAQGCVFYTAYVVQNQGAHRPLTFAFNGGPGSASLWLHLGLMGPKRVDMGSDGLSPNLPVSLIDNEYSPLDITDVVMIDPIATGFSHPVGGASTSKFFGVKNDYVSIGSFVQNYLNLNLRWTSPIYILGESYGGMRGSLLAKYLQAELRIALSGVIFISPAFSWTPLDFGTPDNNVSYWTFLPSFATTAWYHKKLPPNLQSLTVEEVFAQAKKFAFTEYRDALDRGDDLSEEEFSDLAQKISDFTGLDKNLVEQEDLAISDTVFFANLKKSESEVIGRYDGRFTSHQADIAEEIPDPSGTIPGFAYTAAINTYLREDLRYQAADPYAIFAEIPSWPAEQNNPLIEVVGELEKALSLNPKLKVMVASGYFDLATPLTSVDYELSQMPHASKHKSQIQIKTYFGGHMMYINPEALKRLKTDLTQFYK